MQKNVTFVTDEHPWDRKGFWALVLTQLQGAFNDNLYRWIITYYLFRKYLDPATGDPDAAKAAWVAALGAVLFSLPYLMFPGIAGALSDRFSKRTVAIGTKVWEVLVMALGLVAFSLDIEPLIWAMFFFMCMQSAFFSPARYGILPEILPETRLSWGNGIMNMACFCAIIGGMISAGLLFHLGFSVHKMSLALIILSCLGLGASLFITRVPAADPQRRIPINPYAGLGPPFRAIYNSRMLLVMLVAGAFFWFAGALVQSNVPILGRVTFGIDELNASILLAFVGVGIGFGSLAAGILSGPKIELGLVPIGMGGVALFAGLLAVPTLNPPAAGGLLFCIGVAAGFFVVPIEAMIQHRSPRALRGGVIAVYNVATCTGILLAGGLIMAARGFLPNVLHVDARFLPYWIFAAIAVLTLIAVAGLIAALPIFILRLGFWLLTNTLYRLRMLGADNVPEDGPVLLVANYSNFAEILAIRAALDRPVHFPFAESYFAGPWRLLGRVLGTSRWQPRSLADEAPSPLEGARRALEAGEVVCISTEGGLLPDGGVVPFDQVRDALTADGGVPVLPLYAEPLCGHLFRVVDGEVRFRWPGHTPYIVSLGCGAPQPPDKRDLAAFRFAIRDVSVEVYSKPTWKHPLVHREFVRTMWRCPFVPAVADGRTPALSMFKTYVASILLARKLSGLLDKQPYVGVLVPPSVGGALTNIALQIMGKIPVNLNYTASAETMAAAARQCKIVHVITARAFLERLPLEVPGEPVYLEDIMASVQKSDRIKAILMALCMPIARIERLCGAPPHRSQDDLATVVFSSGSEGQPKGVMLTHFNVLSNIKALGLTFPNHAGDGIMGILPFFHSFGFTVTLWTALVLGMGAIYHPNPLEARIIGGLMKKYRPTFFMATSTFLQAFIRRCSKEQLSSLRYILCGAEKLATRVREAFMSKFETEPIEGYGVTECTPVISCNVPPCIGPGCRVDLLRRGTIGRPIPGVNAKVIDPDTGEELPTGQAGLLMIKGPNVMRGYLDMPQKTAEVLRDGWYETGDIAAIDDEGFITITDRLARFSKIGGEMVPHIKVEEALHSLLNLTDQSLAVASVPDAARGERLVVLHVLDDEDLDALLSKLEKCDLPNLWRPRPNAFYRIDEIPVLGTGKMDIKAVKNLAMKLDLGE